MTAGDIAGRAAPDGLSIALVHACFGDSLPPGAVTTERRHVTALAAALTGLGHRVTVWSAGCDTSDRGLERHLPVAGWAEATDEPALLPLMPRFGEALASAWAHDPPDVVHAQGWLAGLAVLVARRIVPVCVVQSFHGFAQPEAETGAATAPTAPPTVPAARTPARRLRRPVEPVVPHLRKRARLEQAIARDADRLLAASAAEVDHLVRMGVPRRSTTLIPHGIDVELFTDVGPSWPRGERHRIVTVIGEDARGLQATVQAMRALPEAELLVAGRCDDALGAAVDRLALSAGAGDRVRRVGWVDHLAMPALLRSADLVVATPAPGSYGRIVLEAMACTRPVVATAVGGARDAVADGVTGLLVAAGRPDLIAAAVRRLLQDEFRRESYGEAALDRVRSRYRWDRVATETGQVYASMLRPEPGSSIDDEVVDLTASAEPRLVEQDSPAAH